MSTLMKILTIFTIVYFFSGCATKAVIPKIEEKQAIEVKPTDANKLRPIKFKKIVIKLKRGQHIGAVEMGLACIPHFDLKWKGPRLTLSNEDLTDIFKEELEKEGYYPIGSSDNLFEDDDSKAELLVAGLVKDMRGNICYPWGGFGNFSSVKGEAYMKVQWQIYDRLARKVIYTTTTEGSYIQSDTSDDPNFAWESAFAIAVHNLLADKKFFELVTERKIKPKVSTEEKIKLSSPHLFKTNIKRNLLLIKSAVVTVYAGNGFGSGFFISEDGYILTNQHVVKKAKFVKVKLQTGREILGEVIRINTGRDVALIKTEESGFNALPIATKIPNIGDEVFVVGTPVNEKLSATFVKGMVSSYKAINGLKYILCDISVAPGDSGAPLLDSNGNVVGITVAGIMINKAPIGLNFFIPIKDALRYLNVELK